MLKVGIIGFGTLGKSITKLIQSHQAGEVDLKAVLVRNKLVANESSEHPFLITIDENEFFNQNLDIIIEAAGHDALQLYGEQALRSGSNLMVLSVGAFADSDFYGKLQNAAKETSKQILIPSAAIAGLDRIAAGALGEIEEITLITRKPTRSWYGTFAEEMVDLETIDDPYCIFDGVAQEAAKLFPENINVSAALSIAGIGFDQTKVKVFVDPTIERNTHTIHAKGFFGEVKISIQNIPFKQNPKSSPIVAMSVAKVLNNLTSAVVVGI
jgi:aspartate dehydrogenase